MNLPNAIPAAPHPSTSAHLSADLQESMTSYEVASRARANRFVFFILAAHIPALILFAAVLKANMLLALIASIILCLLPGLLVVFFPHKIGTSMALAAATMGMSALLIYLGQGRIEYHFHIFSFLAVLISLCSVRALLTAAAVIATHHIVGWLLLPSAVFNYAATFGDVLLHAVFVVVETVICCFVARQLAATLRSRGILEEQVAQTASQVAGSAQHIVGFLARFSAAAESQARVLDDVAQSSARIRAQSLEHGKVAVLSRSQMQENAEQVGDAFGLVSHINVEMQEVCSSNRRISGIISMMNDIARQTSILAVNASIEASRSGNSGGGFGVIADQVRELSARTTAATADIESIVNTSVEKVTASAKMLEHIRSIMNLVDHNTARINTLIGQLSENNSSQTNDIQQIAAAVERLARESQDVSQAAGRSNTAGTELQTLATQLQEGLSILS
jgi:methyl-accepting chemotaxis protein